MGKIRLRHGSSEIELEGDEDFIERQLANFYERFKVDAQKRPELTDSGDTENETGMIGKPNQSKPTPAEFFINTAKGNSQGITQILVFSKYLELHENISEFTAKQINDLVAKAKLPKDIHKQFFSNAVKDGLLRSDKSGHFSLTISGESKLAEISASTGSSKPKQKARRAGSQKKGAPDSATNDGTPQPHNRPKAKAINIEIEKFDAHSAENKPSLEDFFKEKSLGASSGEKLAIIAYYITKHNGAESFSEGNIDYAYRLLKLKNRPKHLRQILINNKNNNDLFDFNSSGDRWVLTRTGLITVEDRLPRTSE